VCGGGDLADPEFPAESRDPGPAPSPPGDGDGMNQAGFVRVDDLTRRVLCS